MKSNILNKKVFLTLILFLFSVIMINIIPNTLGFMLQRFNGINSASAAKFNIVITTPNEFDTISENNYYKHGFMEEGEIKSLNFSVSNNGEVDVLCIPYISGNVNYHLIVSDEIKNEFALKIGETKDFQIVIMSDGLNAGVTHASIFIDVKQFERS